MISHAAATDIPIAHPITPPKFAAITSGNEIDSFIILKKLKNLRYPAYQQLCSVGL